MLKITALFSIFIISFAQFTHTIFIPLKAIPISEQELKEAEKTYKEKLIKKAEKDKLFKKEDILLFEESLQNAPPQVKTIISNLIFEKSRNKPTILVIAGPVDSGKSILAESIGYHLDRKPMVIGASTLVSRDINQTIKNIEKVFNDVNSSTYNCVLIINEIDFLVEYFEKHSQKTNIPFKFHDLIQKYNKNNDLLVIGTCMSTTVISQYDKIITLEKPSALIRYKAIEFNIKRYNVMKDAAINEMYFYELANKTKGFGYRAIEGLVNRAILHAHMRTNTHNATVTHADFENAFNDLMQEKKLFWSYS